jgi:glycosyltransferase involved in cell wall biosynthesis
MAGNVEDLRVALVHDYLNEFGGAERVLLALSEIWPEAPIYTAFYKKDSPAYERFRNKDLRQSWAAKIPGFASGKLHSPLRFLTPLIWDLFDFSQYDLVLSSASWYITKGFKNKGDAIEICYCHTPPRWLYGYPTSVDLKKYWPVQVYAALVGHFLRLYDYQAAQRVDHFIANSKNVAARIEKFYRRQSTVIYPPIEKLDYPDLLKENFYLIIGRIVGGKGFELAIKAVNKLGLRLKIAGKPAGWKQERKRLEELAGDNVQFLGYVPDQKLAELYTQAKGFLVLATDEDFGMTPLEAMMAGTPVIAYRGGGYLESVVEGKTGVFFDQPTMDSLIEAIKEFEKTDFSSNVCRQWAERFSKKRFKKEIKDFVVEKMAE